MEEYNLWELIIGETRPFDSNIPNPLPRMRVFVWKGPWRIRQGFGRPYLQELQPESPVVIFIQYNGYAIPLVKVEDDTASNLRMKIKNTEYAFIEDENGKLKVNINGVKSYKTLEG